MPGAWSLIARRIDAPGMLRIGYLTAIVSAEVLDAEIVRLAGPLVANAPITMRGMKQTINEFACATLDEIGASVHR